MEVKDVPSVKPVKDGAQPSNLQRSIGQLGANKAQSLQVAASVVVATDVKKPSTGGELRTKINSAINVTNVARDATQQLGKLVESLAGIAYQAKDENSPSRVKVLEREANELISEIKKTAQKASPQVSSQIPQNDVRAELEKELGRTLDSIFPDEASSGFGLGQVKFSPKESILNTITTIAQARESIEKLRSSVDETGKLVAKKAVELDVALQNTEASESSVRDLDSALKLAEKTSSGISGDPSGALGSVGVLSKGVLRLLSPAE